MSDVIVVLLIDGLVLSVIGILLLEIHRDLSEITRTIKK